MRLSSDTQTCCDLFTPASPHEQFTQPVSLNSPPNLTPPIPHLNAKYLVLYLNRWHFLEIWHSGGFCGARCVFCTRFGRKKVHFWGCLDRPLLQDISIINYKCYITMLQCQIWCRGAGNACEWKALTQGTKGKRENMSLHTCFEFDPGFSSQSCGQIHDRQNLNGVNRWPDWFLANFFPYDIGGLFPAVPSHSIHDPQFTPELQASKQRFNWISEGAPKYLPISLHLSPAFKHLLKEQKVSYPMHVSGHELVQWVQRYACAK